MAYTAAAATSADPSAPEGQFDPEQPTKDDQLQMFGSTLAAVRDEWIRARAASGWDKRVKVDIDQYHGRDAATKMVANMMTSVEQGFPVTIRDAKPQRSTVFVQVTRQKTNAGEARLADILLPTDDRNWGIKPEPDPQGANALNDNSQLINPLTGQPILFDQEGNVTTDPTKGQPATKSMVAQAAQQYAEQCANGMQVKIDDQLVKSDYNGEVRKMLHFSALTGTGVLRGPIVVKRVHRAWLKQQNPDGSTTVVKIAEEEISPASKAVDPRYVWEDPACGEDPKNGRGIFEMSLKTKRQVRDLAKQPGYLPDQLRAVIEEGPKVSAALQNTEQDVDERDADPQKTFQHWIYHGELERDDLEAAGVDLSDLPDDPLVSVCGCVEMINNTVVRAYLNPLEDHPIPYDFFPWEKVTGSPRGYGIPYLMRAEQNVINAAWRQLLDNSGVTSGPQIVIRQSSITPADGQWQLTPRKIWLCTDDSMPVQNQFGAVEFNNHQQELSAIIEMAEKLADQGTGLPQIMQGEKGTSPDTVGGMQMLMNSGGVVLRRLVKQFDDYVTKPHIGRYYDFNMQYSDDDEVKGDFTIDARGSSALVIRDIQNQAFLGLLQMAANPMFSPMLDLRKLFEKALQAQHIDPQDIMLTEQQVEANQANRPPQIDPRIQAAQISAQAKMKQADAMAQARQAEVNARTQAEVEDRNLRVQELMIQRDIEIVKMATTERISINEIKAQLAQAVMQDAQTRHAAAMELATEAAHIPTSPTAGV